MEETYYLVWIRTNKIWKIKNLHEIEEAALDEKKYQESCGEHVVVTKAVLPAI